jgi:hypothetical protein
VGQRTKRTLKKRPKYRQARSLRGRRISAAKKAAHKRGLNKSRSRSGHRVRRK